eukprot:EG_transcript_10513
MGWGSWPPAADASEVVTLSPCSDAGLPPSSASGKRWRWLLPVAALALGLCLGLLLSPRTTRLLAGPFPGGATRYVAGQPWLGLGRAHRSGPRPTPSRLALRAGAEAPEGAPATYFGNSLRMLEAILSELEPSGGPNPPAANNNPFISAPMMMSETVSSIVSLWFPDLATSTQHQNGARGVALEFALKTAVNANTLPPDVAADLALPIVGQSTTASKSVQAGRLGEAQIDNLLSAERSTLVTDLQAYGFSGNSIGALGVPFLNSFAAVEFRYQDWEVRFHREYTGEQTLAAGLVRVPTRPLGKTGMVRVMLNVGPLKGVPALLDTSRPYTVLSPAAAAAAGLRPGAEQPLRVAIAARKQELVVGEMTVREEAPTGLESLGLGDSFAILGTDVLERCGTLVLRRGQPAIFLGLPSAA